MLFRMLSGQFQNSSIRGTFACTGFVDVRELLARAHSGQPHRKIIENVFEARHAPPPDGRPKHPRPGTAPARWTGHIQPAATRRAGCLLTITGASRGPSTDVPCAPRWHPSRRGAILNPNGLRSTQKPTCRNAHKHTYSTHVMRESTCT